MVRGDLSDISAKTATAAAPRRREVSQLGRVYGCEKPYYSGKCLSLKCL